VTEKMAGWLLEKFSGRKTMESPLEGLSDRELEVFQLIGQGKTMKEIGAELHLSPKTIEVHRSHIREKLRITGAAELISYAARWSETQGVTWLFSVSLFALKPDFGQFFDAIRLGR
jgi:DNA-binding CsgD family transcriptional regulator